MGWPTKFSKTQIAEALDRGQQTRVVNNGWIRLDSSTSNPTDLGALVTPGNYVTSFWRNGPSLGDDVVSPLKITVTIINDEIHQFISAGEKKFHRMKTVDGDIYGKFNILTVEGAINPGPDAPITPIDGKTLWLDTSNPDAPSLKIFMLGVWVEGYIDSDEYRTWISVCYGNGKYIAIACYSNKFAYSYDGITWIEGNISDTITTWCSVCYGDDKFVAVGRSNKFRYSYDGITWIEGATIGNSIKNWSVCYGDGRFVAIGYMDLAYSTDGINWTFATIDNNTNYWHSVCYGDGRFVVLSSSGIVAYSDNGIKWDTTVISNNERDDYSGICYGDEKFIVIASEGTVFNYSTDGITWKESILNDEYYEDFCHICYGNGKYVAISSSITICAESSTWEEIIPEGSMKSEIYDPNGKRIDIFKYIDDAISNASLDKMVDLFNHHITDSNIHTSTAEKSKWNKTATENDINNAVNSMKTSMEETVEESVNENIAKVNNLLNSIDQIKNTISAHSTRSSIHPSAEKQAEWDNKADADHEHMLDDQVTVDISDIAGKIPSSMLPYNIKERAYVVSSIEEMYQLQKNPVHNGDLICVDSENQSEWYYVIDDRYLGTNSAAIAFKQFSIAGSLNWNLVLEKPITVEGYGIEDCATVTEVNQIKSELTKVEADLIPHNYGSAVSIKESYESAFAELISVDAALVDVLEAPVSILEKTVGII